MSTPKIRVKHARFAKRIRIAAFVDGREGAIFVEDIPPINARALSKFKLTLRQALQLRYQ